MMEDSEKVDSRELERMSGGEREREREENSVVPIEVDICEIFPPLPQGICLFV